MRTYSKIFTWKKRIRSFFIPGLGQLLQGRMFAALLFFVFACVMWVVLLGWLVHLWAIIDAAMFKSSKVIAVELRR